MIKARDRNVFDHVGVKADSCPNVAEHTAQPRGEQAWQEWATEKSKTHDQYRCDGCGLWMIWRPKQRP